jgi:hypothetical protein
MKRRPSDPWENGPEEPDHRDHRRQGAAAPPTWCGGPARPAPHTAKAGVTHPLRSPVAAYAIRTELVRSCG